MFQLKVDMTGDLKQLKAIGAYPLQIRKAMMEAHDTALAAMRREAVQDVTADYWIKPTALKKAITVQNYMKGGRFVVKGTRQLLHHYKLSPTKRKRKPEKLYGAVKKAGGLKPLGRAFLMKSGNKYLAMMRKGNARLPLKALVGPAVPQIVMGYWDSDIAVVAQETLRAVFWEKVRRFMNAGVYESADLSRYSSADKYR